MPKLTKEEALQLYDKIEPHLLAIEKLFKSAKATLVLISDDLPNGDLLMTRDDPERVIEAIRRRVETGPVIGPDDVMPLRALEQLGKQQVH